MELRIWRKGGVRRDFAGTAVVDLLMSRPSCLRLNCRKEALQCRERSLNILIQEKGSRGVEIMRRVFYVVTI